jgi:hypothetical protein
MLPEYFTRERYPSILPTLPQYQVNTGTNREWEVKKGDARIITYQEVVEPILCQIKRTGGSRV